MISMTMIGLISVCSIGFLWISSEWSTFEKEAVALRESYIENQKQILKREVAQAIDFVNYMQAQTDNRLKDSIKNRVNEAHAIAENLYDKNKDSKQIEEIKEIIREALRPIRFNKGRGYYFAFDLEGVETLFAAMPEMEGNNMMQIRGGGGELVVSDMLSLIQEKGEGFYDYSWTKPGQEGYFSKIAFVKLIKSIGWVIGTGEYIDDVEKDIQEECIQWISNIKYGKDGYVFAAQWDGISLSGPAVGKNMYDLEDVNGVKIVQQLIEASKNGGGFIHYVLPKFEGKKNAPKISYAVGVPKWQWYIGSGLYVDEIETIIAVRYGELKRKINTHIRNIFLIIILVTACIGIIVNYLSHRIHGNLTALINFFGHAATEAMEIQKNALHFSEFDQLAESANAMIVKQKQTENALRESKKLLETAIEQSPAGILISDAPDVTIRYINQAAYRIRGINPDSATDRDIITCAANWQAFYPDGSHYPSEKLPLSRAILEGNIINGEEIIIRDQDGNDRWISCNAAPIPDDTGKIIAGIVIFYEITARKKAENILKESEKKLQLTNDLLLKNIAEIKKTKEDLKHNEEKYRTLFESANDAIFLIENDLFIDCNQKTLEIFHCSKKEIIGRTPYQYSPEKQPGGRDSKSAAREKINAALTGDSQIFEWQHCRSDGSMFDAEVSLTALYFMGKHHILAIVRDISERKFGEQKTLELQNRLNQAHKMEAIGTLAGGIAHDFNNILSGILGYSQLAETHIYNPEKVENHLRQIIKGAQRAAELVHQILTFSRQKETEKSPLRPSHEVKEALKLLRSSIPSTIEMRDEIDSRSMIMADPIKIHQIVMNLCTNAYHAMMDKGGILKVLLKDIVISEPRTVGDKDIAIGKYLLLEIRDTGHGMDSVILEKAFDPYFTTKKMGEGTGLGLSIVKAIVEEHNGFIEVTSITGKGTHFYIYFPIIEQETSKQIKDNVTSAFQGNECIMIVDDEEDIRICFKEILGGCGYRVHLFQNGIDALKAFEKNVQQFDLIITDMTMPGMTGAELIQKIHAIRQDIPSILCSGFSGLMNDEKALQFGVGRCLMKPVSKRGLASAIREMIDKKIS